MALAIRSAWSLRGAAKQMSTIGRGACGPAAILPVQVDQHPRLGRMFSSARKGPVELGRRRRWRLAIARLIDWLELADFGLRLAFQVVPTT
jgi:hypothetical protein